MCENRCESEYISSITQDSIDKTVIRSISSKGELVEWNNGGVRAVNNVNGKILVDVYNDNNVIIDPNDLVFPYLKFIETNAEGSVNITDSEGIVTRIKQQFPTIVEYGNHSFTLATGDGQEVTVDVLDALGSYIKCVKINCDGDYEFEIVSNGLCDSCQTESFVIPANAIGTEEDPVFTAWLTTYAADIANLDTKILAVNTELTTIFSNISSIQGDVYDNTTSITSLQSDVDDNTTTINDHELRIVALENDSGGTGTTETDPVFEAWQSTTYTNNLNDQNENISSLDNRMTNLELEYQDLQYFGLKRLGVINSPVVTLSNVSTAPTTLATINHEYQALSNARFFASGVVSRTGGSTAVGKLHLSLIDLENAVQIDGETHYDVLVSGEFRVDRDINNLKLLNTVSPINLQALINVSLVAWYEPSTSETMTISDIRLSGDFNLYEFARKDLVN